MDKKKRFIELWEEAGGEQAEKGILKKLSEQLKVPEGTIRRWKSEHLKKNGANVHRTNVKNERSKKDDELKKKEAYKEVLNGETQDNIGQKLGVSRSTIANWSVKYKWQVEKEVKLNNMLFEIREAVIGDRGLKIQELIEWQQKQLSEIKRHIEAEFEKDKPDMSIINFKLATMDKYLKMQFKLLGIRYTGELTDLVRVANQIDTDERKLNIEELKAQKEEETDNNIEIRITGEVKDV